MASARVINYILYKRFVTTSSLKNVSIFSNYNIKYNFQQSAFYCTRKSIAKADSIEHENKVQVSFAEVVKENTKSAGYLGVIIGGVGIVAFMFYMIFDELFSSKSPNSVYSKALDVCIKNQKVRDALGEPIKGYGEETRRGRRTHINHITFMKNNVRHMRMKFYIQGIRKRGTVHLEVQEDQSGKYVYRYLYVVVDGIMQPSVIEIEENRDPDPGYSDQTDFVLN